MKWLTFYAAIIGAATIIAVSGYRAHAQEVGTGILCDTQAEAAQFASLADKGGQAALDKVNAGAKSDTACMAAQVVFLRGKTVQTVINGDGAIDIVEVTVVGTATAQGLVPTQPVVQYTLFQAKGTGI